MATSFCGKTTGLLDEGYSANGGEAEACRALYSTRLLAAMRVEATQLEAWSLGSGDGPRVIRTAYDNNITLSPRFPVMVPTQLPVMVPTVGGGAGGGTREGTPHHRAFFRR